MAVAVIACKTFAIDDCFSDDKIEWMIAPARLLHGNLGWLLLFMVIGHAAMAFVHRRQGGDGRTPWPRGR